MKNDLPHWFPHFISCGKCNTNGFIITNDVSTKCSCKIEYDNKINLLFKLLHTNVIVENSSTEAIDFIMSLNKDSYKGKDNNGNLKKVELFIEKFKDKYSGLNLFFSGSPGTQKTTIAKYIIKQLLQKNINCYYILANDLIEYIIESSRDIEQRKIIHDIINVDFLVIDEFSENSIVTFASGWQRKHLFPWLKLRLETLKKSTLFISNNSIDNLGKYFEGAIQDLILREVPDHTMIFEDNYIQNRGKLDLSSIWED